jgi:hypothetical protein
MSMLDRLDQLLPQDLFHLLSQSDLLRRQRHSHRWGRLGLLRPLHRFHLLNLSGQLLPPRRLLLPHHLRQSDLLGRRLLLLRLLL